MCGHTLGVPASRGYVYAIARLCTWTSSGSAMSQGLANVIFGLSRHTPTHHYHLVTVPEKRGGDRDLVRLRRLSLTNNLVKGVAGRAPRTPCCAVPNERRKSVAVTPAGCSKPACPLVLVSHQK